MGEVSQMLDTSIFHLEGEGGGGRGLERFWVDNTYDL